MDSIPEDIQRQIDQLEAMRATLGDAMVDDAIAKLQAKLPAQDVKGTATTRDNYGQNIGVNYGIAIIGRRLEDDEQQRLGWACFVVVRRRVYR